ncbi:DNA-binding winged helix-turn-helix (wHTH) protein [Dokdonella fugitiva]|uniref:DNA-binding winged helix-turn-helix (WHTH) protein n=1 Tax=Dokdonella fugitiva TaxID=328517 RepID=A0A839F1N9_9GAMM|nr:winged helix-turn-helix domain-containing protein [Dokdonella fugitiva]MBA8887418.1 DNA-binding winged helix-turn-helix (wHTH) protein [Dokdonella fugitiva]
MTAYHFGAFTLDASTRELRKDGTRIALPSRAFTCLLMLVERRERAVDRDELIRALWRHGAATDVQLGQLVVQCRRALDDDGQTQWAIRTVAGFGYQWVAPTAAVEVASAPPAPAPPRDRDAAVAPPPPVREPRRARRVGLALMFAILLAATAAWLWHRSGEQARGDASIARVVVLPLATGDGDDRWLRLGGMDLVADRLRRSGLVVQPSELTVGQLRALGEGDGDAAASLRRIAPTATLVEGEVRQRDGRWFARVRATREGDAPPLSVACDDAGAIAAVRGAADRLAAALGRMPADAADADSVGETLQRAQAALLANEPDTARSILLGDARLAHDTPRLRQQLAEVDIRAGRLDEARRTLEELLPATTTDRVFRAQLLAARGLIAVRSGEYADAGHWFGEGIDLLGDAPEPQLRGRLHNGRAVSRTSLEDYPAALLDYGIARDAFQRAGDEGGVARVDGNIGAMELLRAHPAQAEPYLTAAIARFEALGLVQERIGELQLLFEARRAQLDDARAWEAMDASWAQRARVPSRYSRLSMRLYRTEQLLQQGRHNEAGALLDDPANDGRPADAAENERIRLLRAELAWRRGDGDGALAELAPVPAGALASADSDLIRADVELLRARIERATGHARASPGAADPGGDRPANARTPIRLLAAANRAWAERRDDEAAHAFAAAFALAQAQGVPLTILRVAQDYVDHLLARGRVAEAAVIANQVALWADHDYDAALVQLALARAQGRREAWQAALDATRRLAGERAIPRVLGVPPG